jgi:hypothetical protein
MPRRAKPDDPDWIDLSANQKRQIKAAMRRIAKTRDIVYSIPNGEPPIPVWLKVLNEEFAKAARRKIN